MNYTLLLLLFSIPLLGGGILFYSCNSPKTHAENLTKDQLIKLYEQKYDLIISNMRDYCFVPINNLEGMYAIGSFASDRGCKGNEISLGRRIGKTEELMKDALIENGWDDKEKRAQLALLWVKEVMLVWESPLTSKNDDFEKEGIEFQEPKVEQIGQNWQVTIWVQKPAGMLPQSNYYQLKVSISPKAKIIEQKSINSFSHSYH